MSQAKHIQVINHVYDLSAVPETDDKGNIIIHIYNCVPANAVKIAANSSLTIQLLAPIASDTEIQLDAPETELGIKKSRKVK